MNSKLLVTGTTGFVGKQVINLLPISRVAIRTNSYCKSDDYFEIKELNNNTDWVGAFNGIDGVIHLAGLAHSHLYTEKDYREVNVHGTLHLASEAAKAGVKRFVFVSSIVVNGTKTKLTCFNPFSVPKPDTIFAHSKYDTEIGLKKIAEETGLEIVIIRPPLVYGEGVKANFAALLNLVTKKIPLPFGAITKNRRSLVSVYNLVDLIETCIHHPNAANKTFLVSDDHDLSTTEMVKLMASVQGIKPWLLPVPIWILKRLGKLTGKSDMISRLTDSLQVDITHTKETLDWTPPYSVEEGFAKSVQTHKHTSQTS